MLILYNQVLVNWGLTPLGVDPTGGDKHPPYCICDNCRVGGKLFIEYLLGSYQDGACCYGIPRFKCLLRFANRCPCDIQRHYQAWIGLLSKHIGLFWNFPDQHMTTRVAAKLMEPSGPLSITKPYASLPSPLMNYSLPVLLFC